MTFRNQYYIRKTHRWLGLLLGIQFLMWTIGGLYFSWTNIDEVHGDFQKRNAPLFNSDVNLVSPTIVLDSIKSRHPVDSVVSIQLIEIFGKPHYQVRCLSVVKDKENMSSGRTMNHLANAENGQLRGPLTKDEAIKVAGMRYKGEPKVRSVSYLTQLGSHHEYRENPLPAYAVTFEHPTNTTVYVASELGTVQKFRNNKWRVFDFLWMMHTMDYEGRDNFSNIFLRIFSIFGLVTILSGFVLFFISAKRVRFSGKKIKQK